MFGDEYGISIQSRSWEPYYYNHETASKLIVEGIKLMYDVMIIDDEYTYQ